MINSLLKDSHIAQPFSFQNYETASQNRKQRRGQSATVNTSVSNSVDKCKPANISFGGFFSAEKLAKNKKFLGMLDKIHDNPALFDATFALGITCLLRPATILALPSEKKNKGDNLYAATHSIASGIISYAITLVLTNPIAKATKKAVAKMDAKSYLKKATPDAKKTYFDVASTYIKKCPEAIIALPRATITIALIPVILKYVFGIEKNKKPKSDKTLNPILDNPATINHHKVTDKETRSVNGGVK